LKEPVKRSYDSSRRRAQAEETRSLIVRTAQRLFLEQGYGATSVADIARAAGVSVETIYGAFGSKAALLRKAWDITIGGDDQDIAFHERPEIVAIRDEPDLAQRLRLHATFTTQTAQRIAPFQIMVQAAAEVDPVAAEMLDEMERQHLAGMSIMSAEVAQTGQLATSETECRDILWSTTDGMLWHRLVVKRGWTNERFAEWLGELWTHLLVNHQPEADPTRSLERKPHQH
jgi:AcrR family transcriptional regulator